MVPGKGAEMKDRTGIEQEQEAQWHARLDVPGAAARVEPLGPGHAAILAEEDAVLLVTFERAADILSEPADGQPLAATLAEAAGWSRLTLVSEGESWFRDPAIYAYFDRLEDEGFFDGYDRVIFYGAGPCGYAAAAYSVAAPGAVVIALNPQATLEPARAGWDDRFRAARRLDFTSRYGFAPDMAQAAAQVFVIYDPTSAPDAMHAALFGGDNVTRLRAPLGGPDIQAEMMALGVLPELVDAAGEAHLTPLVFHRLYRARRRHLPYLRRLVDRLEAAERPWLAALACRNIAARLKRPRFARRQARLEELLAEDGRALPAPYGG